MRIENGSLEHFSNGHIVPLLQTVHSKSGHQLKYEEDENALAKKPNQIHINIGDEIYIRIAKSEKEDEQVITLIGGNPYGTPTFVVSVNGDDSWKEEFLNYYKTLCNDSYYSEPEPEDED